jgi:hypothetical protein
MAYMITSDISRMLEVGQRDIFMRNFESYPLEYPDYTTNKSSTKRTETYDSMGNLQAAAEKVEGADIQYGKVTQAYQTSITNKTWANGFEHTLEAIKYDLYGCVNSVKAKELARTMRELEEANCIRWIDNALTVTLADGAAFASASKPLVDSPSLNSTLATASSIAVPANHKTVLNMFYAFLNHSGGHMKSKPTNALTHFVNQFTVEELYGSSLTAKEMSNTKNVLPGLRWAYSTYMSSQTAWMVWDNSFEHIIFQSFMGTTFGNDVDNINTKNVYQNAIAMYQTGCLPNIGIVYNAGA